MEPEKETKILLYKIDDLQKAMNVIKSNVDLDKEYSKTKQIIESIETIINALVTLEQLQILVQKENNKKELEPEI